MSASDSTNNGLLSTPGPSSNRPRVRCMSVRNSPDEQALRICQLSSIPSARAPPPVEVIFVLDTSGSMWWVWEPLASAVNKFIKDYSKQFPIAVIQYAKLVSIVDTHDGSYIPLKSNFEYNELKQAYDHIQLAFISVRDYIEKRRKAVSEETRFNICYMADGGDTESGNCLVQRLENLRDFCPGNVTFTTIACGNLFPTNTMMVLRKMFHDTNFVATPLLTPVSNEAVDFAERFETVIPHLIGESTVLAELEEEVQKTPWEGIEVKEIAVGSWFVLGMDRCRRGLIINNVEAVIDEVKMNMTDVTAIGRQWTREIHTQSVFEHVRFVAAKAVSYFRGLVIQAVGEVDDAIDHVDVHDVRTSAFAKRLQRKKAISMHHEASRIINELDSLAKHNLAGLTDEQLAQRLAIGTRDSKHLDRAVKWKGALTTSRFEAARERFKEIYNSLLPQIRQCQDRDPYRSAISLESNVEVLADKTFLLKLFDEAVSSQFALVECLPVVGLALKTYVSNGTVINPWLVRVDAIPRLTRYLDIASLYNIAEDKMFAHISAGLDNIEEVSAICPLIAPETAAVLGPILRSRLYQIMMTFQVTRNMDTVDKASHLALLASVLSFLVKEKPSDWRNELLHSVVFTASVLVGDGRKSKTGESTFASKSFLEYVVENPAQAVVTSHPTLTKKCESISKVLLAVAILKSRSLLFEKSGADIWDRIVGEYVGRAVIAANPERCWEQWFSLNDVQVSSFATFDSVFGHDGFSEDEMQSFASVREIVAVVQNFDKYLDFVRLQFGGLSFKMKDVISAKAASNGPVDWEVLQGFESEYMKDNAVLKDEQRIRSYVAHAVMYSGSYERSRHDIEAWNDSIEARVITRLVSHAKMKVVQVVRDEVALTAQGRMIAFMRNVHRRGLVLPMSEDQIRQERLSRYGLETTMQDLRQLKYDDKSGLCRSACQNAACARFLIHDRSFADHLVNSSHSGGRPTIAFHRAVHANRHKSIEEIKQSILSGNCRRSGNKEAVVQSISETFDEEAQRSILAIRDAYRQFEAGKKAA